MKKHQIDKKSWMMGYESALWIYAHWQNGIQRVGFCGTTYKEALNKAEAYFYEQFPDLVTESREPTK